MKIENYHMIGKHHEERITPLLMQLFDFEMGHQAERLATRIRNLAGKKFHIKLMEDEPEKSLEALGMYFGGLVRAQVMDDKDLFYNAEDLSGDWREYRRLGKVTLTDFDDADVALRLEFFYEWKKTLGGHQIRVPKRLEDKSNPELRKFIDDVMKWREGQGYPYLDCEKYKVKRKQTKLTAIPKADVKEFHKGLVVPEGKPTF